MNNTNLGPIILFHFIVVCMIILHFVIILSFCMKIELHILSVVSMVI